MKVKYLLHSGEYAIGENEKLYADQAVRGWLLEKRGHYFSKFRRGEPQRLRYRIELSMRSIRDDGNLPEEQIALYEDCGWHYVSGSGFVHVFCAPEGSNAPEFYSTPEQQAATLRGLRRSYWWGLVAAAVILGIFFLLITVQGGGLGNVAQRAGTNFVMEWVRVPWKPLSYFAFLAWSIYEFVYGGVRTALLSRRLKRGLPLDHAPKKKNLAHKLVSAVLVAVWLFSLVLIPLQLASLRSYDMPAVSDGPYLVLAELGVEGERIDDDFFDDSSKVEVSSSLGVRFWDTREEVESGGSKVFLYQDIYEMRSQTEALRLVPFLMRNSVLSRGEERFQAVEVPGLDAAYMVVGGWEYVAVRGKLVYYLTYIDFAQDRPEPDFLAALASHTP